MTRSQSSLAALLIVFGVCACNSRGVSDDERREFRALEQALGSLVMAHPEDRGIRLQEVEETKVTVDRIRQLKDLCVSSYRAFDQANQLLLGAKAKTEKAEQAMAKARALSAAGEEITDAGKTDLREMSRAAGEALEAVNTSLDRAEKLVARCEKQRRVLRDLIESS